MRSYTASVTVRNRRPGWKLGVSRVLPRRYTIKLMKLVHFANDRFLVVGEVNDAELVALRDGTLLDERGLTPRGTLIGEQAWMELEIESSPEQRPRCVAMKAPRGIATPELRFPLAEVIDRASAAVASKDGSFFDVPAGIEFEDMVFEAKRARRTGRATKQPITRERLEEVARIVREHPHQPGAAIVKQLDCSRTHAWRLRERAKAEGIE